MKLFLTASSERGKPVTKSGNEYIELELKGENKEVISIIKITQENITVIYNQDEICLSKKQLGYKCNHLISKAVYLCEKLQGYKCESCGFLTPVNPAYQKKYNTKVNANTTPQQRQGKSDNLQHLTSAGGSLRIINN